MRGGCGAMGRAASKRRWRDLECGGMTPLWWGAAAGWRREWRTSAMVTKSLNDCATLPPSPPPIIRSPCDVQNGECVENTDTMNLDPIDGGNLRGCRRGFKPL